jgi:hypothetical protein
MDTTGNIEQLTPEQVLIHLKAARDELFKLRGRVGNLNNLEAACACGEALGSTVRAIALLGGNEHGRSAVVLLTAMRS